MDPVVQFPRVVHRAVEGPAGRAAGELAHAQFSQKDGARVPQPLDDGGIVVGHLVGKNIAAPGRADVPGRQQVLDGEWNPMQRSPISSRGDLLLGRLRLTQGQFGRHRDEAVDLRIERFDSIQIGPGQLDGREFFRPQPGRQVSDRLVAEFFVHYYLSG